MELELGLKVTRTREDVSSSVDFRFSKDPFGPLVLSRETDSRFIIIIHLKGFKKEGIEIDINKEGDKITISGRKPVEEMVMIRWMAWRKEVEMRAFKKVFLIPDVVDLDKIKARFDDDDATLTITMPKIVRGISGFNLEQEEEEEEEGVDFGDVSEVENREDVEEENGEIYESDEHSESQREEGFGEMVEDKERERQVYEGEEEGYSGGVHETQMEDDDLEEIQQTGEQELADSDRESEASGSTTRGSTKLPDMVEQEDNQEVMVQKVSEAAKSDDIGSGETEEIEEEESDEDSGLKELPDMIEQEDNQKVREQKVSEDIKSGDTGSEAVEETEEQESDGNSGSDKKSKDSGLKELPDIIEQGDNQEVIEEKVSEGTKSGDTGSGEPEETEEEKESHEDNILKNHPDIIKQEDDREVMDQKVSEETKRGDIRSGETGETEEKESDEDSGLEEIPDIIEEENNQEVMEQKVSEETRSEDSGSGAVVETEEQESDEDSGSNPESEGSGLTKLPEFIEQEYNQEVMEKRVSEETKSDDTESRVVEDIEEQESDEDSGIIKLDIMEQEDNREEMEQKVLEETKSEDIGSGEVKEIQEQESDEICRTSEKKRTDGDGDGDGDGDDDESLRNAQGIEEPERHNVESKIQEMVEEVINNKEAKREFDGKETQIEDDNLEKSQQTNEEETLGQHEVSDSVTESEERSIFRKLPDIIEQENNQDVMEQKDSQEETRSDDFGSRAFEETEKQEPHEHLDGTSKSRGKADDDALSKVQGIEEPERRNEVRKIQEMVEGYPKEDFYVEMGKGFTPNIERTPVAAEGDVAETKTKAEELESEKIEADKVDKKHELVEKKEEEEDNTKVRREREDRRSLIKLQENEEHHPKGRKGQEKQENIKELIEEKAPEEETNIESDVQKPVQETEAPEVDTVIKTYDEGKEKKKTVKMETAPNIAETEAKPEDFESEKLGADEIDKTHKPVEKKEEEDATVRAKGEDSTLTNLQENEEQHSKERKGEEKQQTIKELVEEKAPEADKNIVNDVPKPVQENEVMEHKFSEETKSDNIGSGALEEIEAQEYNEDSGLEKLPEIKEKVMEQRVSEETKSSDIGSGSVEEMEEEQESDEVGGTSTSIAMEKQETDGGGLRKADGTEEQERHNAKEESNGKETQTDEEKNVGQLEFADSVTETEDSSSSLRKPPDILEQGNNQDEIDPKDSEEETRSEDFGSGAFEEIEKQEPCEQIDATSKSREMADDDGLFKALGIEEPERRNVVNKIQEMVEGETSDHEKRKIVKMEIKRKDPKEDVDAEMGEGFTPNIERTPVLAKTETKAEELESEKQEADEVDKKHELVEKKEEQHSKGRKGQEKQENIKELVEEKAPETETNIETDTSRPFQEIVPEMGTLGETSDEGKQGKDKKSVSDIVETDTKPEEIESDKLEADEGDKIHKLAENKEDEDENNAEVGTQSEDIGSTKPQEVGEQLSQGQKRHKKIKELVKEKTPEAGTAIENYSPKPVYEETSDAESIKPQETIRQQELDECERCDKESKNQELVVSKTNDEEKEEKDIEETATKEQDSYRPKVLGEEEKVQELAEEKPQFSKNREVKGEEKVPEKKTELGDDTISRKAGDSDAEEEFDAEMGKRVTPNTAETVTKPEDYESEKLGADEVEKIHKQVEKKEEEDANVRAKSEDSRLIKLQENEEPYSKGRKLQEKQESIKELVEEKAPDEAEKNIRNDVPRPVQETEPEEGMVWETCDEEKEKKKILHLEVKSRDAKEEVGAKLGVPNIAEAETKPEEFKCDQPKADEVEKIRDLVEKKHEEDKKNAKAGTLSEEQSQGQKKHEKQAKIEESVEEKTPVAETSRGNDTLKPVQERCEGKQKTPKLSQEERKKQPEEHKEKMVETVKKFNEPEGCKKERKILEVVKSITNDKDEEEKETKEIKSKEQESYRPKILGEQEKIKELTEEKMKFSRKVEEDEEIAEKKTEFSDDDDDKSRKALDIDAMKGQEEKEKNQELVHEEKVSLEVRNRDAKEEVDAQLSIPNVAETETKPEEFESDQLKRAEKVDKIHEVVEKKKEEEYENNAETGTESEDISLLKPREVREQQSQGPMQHHKQEKIDELDEKTAEAEEHKEKMVETEKNFNSAGSREDEAERCEKESKILEVVKSETCDEEKEEKEIEETQESYTPKVLWEEEIAEKKTEYGDDDHQVSRRDSDSKEEVEVEMGKGFRPSISETETKGEEFKSQKLEPDVNEDIHDVVEKKEEEEKNAKVRREREDRRSLIEIQENEKKHSKRREKTAEINIPTLVQETSNAGKEKKKSVTTNTAETETKPEEFESDKLESDEIHELVEKEEDNAKMRGQSEDSNLSTKLQETKEKQQDKIKELADEKTPAAAETTQIPKPTQEIEEPEETMEQESHRPKVFGDDDLHFSRRFGDTGQRDSDAKEDVEPEMGKGFTPNISETEKKAEEFESDTVKSVDEEENATWRKKREDSSLERLQEEKFQGPNRHRKQEKIKELVEEKQEAETVQETEKPKVEGLETCEEKVFAETETKDQESYRPKILEGEDKIQELAEEKMNFSRKVDEEKETAEKKTELAGDDDDMSKKAGDIDAMKGQEEKEKIQEQALEEKVSDAANKIVAEAIIAENNKSRKAQELIEGVKGEEREKKTTEVQERFRESQEIERTDSDESGKYVRGELQEEEKEDEDDRLKRETGKIEQEFVNLNSEMEKENGEKTQELVDEEINKFKEEETNTKTEDVIRKVQGTKEQELSEPERNHGSNIEEVMEEKTPESEVEAERGGGLSKVHGSEEEESHEPNIHKEHYKTNITGTEEPSCQEEEEKEKTVEYMTIKEIKDQRPDKESNEKQYKIQELVEAGHNDHKEEQKYEMLTVKAKGETEEETPKVVQETEQQESDGLSSFVVQDKKQETEEKEINRAEERRTKTEDVSLRKVKDDEDPEMSEPYKRQEGEKIHEPVEMGISGYKEEVKKQDGKDSSGIQEPGKPNLDELERHGEQEDKIDEPVELWWTHDDREKDKKEDGDDVPKSVEEEKVENMAELEGKVEDDISEKFHEIEERKSYESRRHEMQEKSKEEATDPRQSEEKEKTRAVEEKRTITRDGSLRKAQDDAEQPELGKPYKPQEEDKVQESVERGTSDYREELKKQDGNDTSRSKELGKPILTIEEATGPKDKRTAEAGHNDHKEEQHEETVIAKTELKAEEDTSEKIQEIEKQKFDELQRSSVQETEEKEETKAMEENESVERRTKTEDGSLRKVGDGKETESSKPYKRLDEDKIQKLVEMETSNYREKVKKQDGDDILRSQETEKLDLIQEEATGPKDEHTGGKEEPEEEEIYERVAQTETKVQDETKKEVEKNQKEEEGSLDDHPMRKTQESEKGESEIHEKLDIVQDFVEKGTRDQEDEVAMEAAAVEAKHDEEQHEEKFITMAEVKDEEDSSEHEFDELQRSLGQDKLQETEEKGKPRSMEENETVEGEKETEDGSLRKVQEGEDPELSRHKRHEEELKEKDEDDILRSQETSKVDLGEEYEKEESEELDIVQDVVEDKTWDQEDDRVGEADAEAVVGNNEKDSSRKLHTTGGEELREHEEQEAIPATSDPRVNEGNVERLAEKETKMEKAHGQKPEGKTENEESRRGQKGKKEKNVETRSDDGIVRKFGETKVQESDEKEDQEPGGKIEEPERKEASNDEVKLAEEDSLIKGHEFIGKESSKRRPVGQENIQQLMDVEKQEDEKKSEAGVEMQAKIKEEKGIEGSEKVAEVEMQAKIGIRIKEKRQELYELLEIKEHEKIPEPVVEGTKYQRVEDREDEEMKRNSEDVSSSNVQKNKAEESDGLEKHRKLSELQENESVDEEELNEAGGYKEVLKTKSQDVEEKGSDQTERHAEQENIQEQMAKKEEEEEEQNEKAQRITQVESKANDDISDKDETEILRGQEQKKDHQEVVKIETSDKRKKEREEKIVGKAVTKDERDSSRKYQEHEGDQSYKLGRHGEEEMSGSLAREETNNDKEENRGNRASAKTTIKDDKKQLVVEIDTSGKLKENRNPETKSRDDSSRENKKQESHEQKRNYEEQDKKKLGQDYCRNDEDGKEDTEISEAEGTRKEGIEEREAAKMVKNHDCQDNITDLVEEKMNNQEGEDKKSMSMEVLKKSEDHESKEPEILRKQNKGSELIQRRSTDNLQDEETKVKDKEARKTHQLIERETRDGESRKEKENRETECEDGSSKKIQEIDKEGSSEPRRDEERDKIQPVDSETSENDSEELEVEVEDSEEDWEAEVIQEMDSDEDNDKLRKISRVKLGFRLVGGSTLFMSLIVIVISTIRSKRKTKCYKF